MISLRLRLCALVSLLFLGFGSMTSELCPCYSLPHDDTVAAFDIIPAGFRIVVVNALSGLQLLDWSLAQDAELHELCKLIIARIAAQVAAPKCCVRIVDALCTASIGEQRRCFSYLWVHVDASEPEGPPGDGENYHACFICGGTCEDADDTDTRPFNCVRCYPCTLCEHCRILLPRSVFCDRVVQLLTEREEDDLLNEELWPVCYWCLTEGEAEGDLLKRSSDYSLVLNQQVSERTWFRMALLSDFYLSKPPVPGFSSWWDRFTCSSD